MSVADLESSMRLNETNSGDVGADSRQNKQMRDMQQPKLSDKVPSVKPNVDYQDKLWTQIDVLDDVKKMGEQVAEDGSFFTEEHNNSLRQLRHAQLELLRTIEASDKVVDANVDHRVVWDCDDLESVRERLYNSEYLGELSKNISVVKDRLDQLDTLMKSVDDFASKQVFH